MLVKQVDQAGKSFCDFLQKLVQNLVVSQLGACHAIIIVSHLEVLAIATAFVTLTA